VGAERSFVELCNELAKSDEVTALVVRGCEFKDRFSDRVEVIELAANPSRYNPFLYFEIGRLISRLGPDIVHTHSAKATEIVYRLWKIMGFGFVATKRNSRENPIFSRVPHLIGVSKEAVRGIEGARVIYNAVTPRPLPAVKKEEPFTILAIGALRRVKGFDRLIDAVATLPFSYRLQIVGDGEEREALERRIVRSGLEERVELLGWRDDTHILQAKAHLQVISSHREGFSRVLIEGLFYSDIVISTPVGGSVEILPKRFIATDLAKKIADVYHNYRDYKEEFGRLRERLQPHFLLERAAEEHRKFYKEIVG
jgi:glycosyltransferase involved in cell wall biosynthesis